MNLSELVTDFLEHLEIEQNRSQQTIANYDHYLRRLVEFTDDCDIKKLNSEMVRQWRGVYCCKTCPQNDTRV